MIYLDWAATAVPDSALMDELVSIETELYGNPSSLHAEGKRARMLLEECRGRTAGTLELDPSTLYFTSGGTESNGVVLTSLLFRRKRSGMVISGIEHPSVWETAKHLKELGCPVKTVKANPSGHIDPDTIASAIDDETGLVAVMAVSNDTGAVQPLKSIVHAVRDRERDRGGRIHIHTDAVQALGKIPFDPISLGVDSAAFSGHKIGAPRGIGMLYLAKPLKTLLAGGEQEGGIRPGTENLRGILGITLAVERRAAAFEELFEHGRRLERRIIRAVEEEPSVKLIGDYERGDGYSPWIVTVSIPPIPGEVLVRIMSDRGFAVSTGSACSAAKAARTRSLENMGIDKKTAFSAIRVSTGPATTDEDIDEFLRVLFKESALLVKSL
ncbi:MAG: cysteine desulfurase family protein [Spirochaetia bacterium]